MYFDRFIKRLSLNYIPDCLIFRLWRSLKNTSVRILEVRKIDAMHLVFLLNHLQNVAARLVTFRWPKFATYLSNKKSHENHIQFNFREFYRIAEQGFLISKLCGRWADANRRNLLKRYKRKNTIYGKTKLFRNFCYF